MGLSDWENGVPRGRTLHFCYIQLFSKDNQYPVILRASSALHLPTSCITRPSIKIFAFRQIKNHSVRHHKRLHEVIAY